MTRRRPRIAPTMLAATFVAWSLTWTGLMIRLATLGLVITPDGSYGSKGLSVGWWSSGRFLRTVISPRTGMSSQTAGSPVLSSVASRNISTSTARRVRSSSQSISSSGKCGFRPRVRGAPSVLLRLRVRRPNELVGRSLDSGGLADQARALDRLSRSGVRGAASSLGA